ncbi:hypothetical protein [Frankia sp. QA3]|uniref:hypothetical protein n=1 Tax=Frankia sp. QA3 TaxID=710111 RepID=UPI000269C837|nr:hypothetical protein [Frankia sp. QA3]EIV95058.1 hypothetical protein FraQA3DRAFT_4859 [Frankia sp. QA3]
MTYDVAVWRQDGSLTGDEASAEFERRMDQAEQRYEADVRDPACPELVELLRRMRAEFAQRPQIWEGPVDGDLTSEADGEFIYITMSWDGGSDVVKFIAGIARPLGLVVYDPQAEAIMS